MTRLLKVAVHVHSSWSFDAEWGLERIAAAFARRGYDAVLLCDHDRGFAAEDWPRYQAACRAVSRGRVLLVPGTEYADPQNLVHVPVWGVPFLGEALPTETVLAAVTQHGGVAFLAHPGRRDAWRQVDPRWLPQLAGIERWNRKYDGWLPSPEAARLLAAAPGALAVVSLDFHRRRQFFPLAMRLRVDGPVSEAAVLQALRSGAAEAHAFGRPLAAVTSGLSWRVLVLADRLRRPAARAVRRVLDR